MNFAKSVLYCLKRHSTLFSYNNILISTSTFANSVTVGTLQSRLITCRFFNLMAKPQVYVTREIPTVEAIKILTDSCEVTTWAGPGPVPREELLRNISGKDALFCMLTDKIDAEVVEEAGSTLKVIGTMSVGYDHLDVKEIQKRNIKIGYTPDVLTDATAELTVALLLATSRRLIEANCEAKMGGWKAWSPFWMCGPSLSGSTVGVVGFGRIGQEVGKRLRPFNIKRLLYYSRSEKPQAAELEAIRVSFDELLHESDFVIATCALTPETQGIFNESAFKKMKSNAVFINTSRGGMVDQEALIEALKGKIIWGAGVDVTTPEPLPLDNDLFKLANAVVLPHIGSASIDTRNTMAILTAKNIVAALENKPMPAELIV